jgi:hypothetical protein
VTRELKASFAGAALTLAVFAGVTISTASVRSDLSSDLEQSLLDTGSAVAAARDADCSRAGYRRYTCAVEFERSSVEFEVGLSEDLCWRAQPAETAGSAATGSPEIVTGCVRSSG